MKNEEMRDVLHPTKQPGSYQTEAVSILFDEVGNSDENSKTKFNADLACAKKTVIGQNILYYLKKDRDGKLYDPSRVGGQYNINGKDKLTGGKLFKFRRSSPDSFKLYLSYLASRHKSLLIQAEREA